MLYVGMHAPLPDPLQRQKSNTTLAMRERYIQRLGEQRDHWVRPLTAEDDRVVSREKHGELVRLALCASNLCDGQLDVSGYESPDFRVSDSLVIGGDTQISRKLERTTGTYQWTAAETFEGEKPVQRRFPNALGYLDFAVDRMAAAVPEAQRAEFATLLLSFADGPLFGGVDQGLAYASAKRESLIPSAEKQELNMKKIGFTDLEKSKSEIDDPEPF